MGRSGYWAVSRRLPLRRPAGCATHQASAGVRAERALGLVKEGMANRILSPMLVSKGEPVTRAGLHRYSDLKQGSRMKSRPTLGHVAWRPAPRLGRRRSGTLRQERGDVVGRRGHPELLVDCEGLA